MTTEENMIPIEPYLKDFQQYLDANSRCILSAKFGNGKSYFVSRFINEYSKEYLFIPIYPVNYQVMDNKDIFELIKRDILIKLLSSEEININEIELNTASLFYYFFTNNQEDRLLDILSIIPDINIYGIDINICNVIKKLKNIEAKFDTYKEQFKSVDKTSELYINKFDSLKGSIYEFDTISQLICDIIQEYKKKNPTKKVVLIIEDLDRIDPAHIFRILNVFSAHFDRYTPGLVEFDKICGDNKFCLDKIVTVCDIENIKKIYTHIYGDKTDFTGYISKFSNSKEYNYSIKEKIKGYIIDNLLDKDILKYPHICDILSDLIVASMDDDKSIESNLRIIKQRIKSTKSLIRPIEIPLSIWIPQMYISSNSAFTYLLALLKNFDLEFNSIYEEKTQIELMFIIGKYWILLHLFENKIKFQLQNNWIRVSFYKEYTKDFGDWVYAFDIRLQKNDANWIDFDLSKCNFVDNAIAELMYNQIENITNYLNRELII